MKCQQWQLIRFDCDWTEVGCVYISNESELNDWICIEPVLEVESNYTGSGMCECGKNKLQSGIIIY